MWQSARRKERDRLARALEGLQAGRKERDRLARALEGLQAEISINRDSYRELAHSYEEQLQFTREVIRRNEIAFADSRRVMAKLAEDVEAQTKAIFEVLDHSGAAAPSRRLADPSARRRLVHFSIQGIIERSSPPTRSIW